MIGFPLQACLIKEAVRGKMTLDQDTGWQMLMGKMWRGAGEMVRKKRLPIGIEDFEEIRTEDFY